MKLIITSLFVSMSFVTPLDYSVVNMRVVDHHSAVMMLIKQKTACSLRCDTRFRFLLRPFGAPVESAPNGPGFSILQ